MRGDFKKILEIIFPATCVGCSTEGQILCLECSISLSVGCVQKCPYCNTSHKDYKTCQNCIRNGKLLDGLIVASDYENKVLKAAIHNFKYRSTKALAEPLGELLLKSLLDAQASYEDLVVCPVPLHKKRLRQRGFNQALLLAEHIVNKTGLKKAELLERITFKKPQMELKKELRKKNVENAFAVKPAHFNELHKMPVLLIDDVATTLSTLEACARELKKSGFKKVYGLVLARVN